MGQLQVGRGKLPLLAVVMTALVGIACGTEKVVVETVVVERSVEKVVEKPVEVIKVVQQTVVVEKPVEKQVVQTVVVERKVEVVATPTAIPLATATPVPAAKRAPNSKQTGGQAIFATASVGENYGGINSLGPMPFIGHALVSEALFTPTKTENAAGLIATSWTVDDDFGGATVKIRQGIQFHMNYGELTAEDVAWSYNDANPGVTPTSITDGSGDWKAFVGASQHRAVDKYTVKLKWDKFDPRWQYFFFGQDGVRASIFSKKAFDQNGGYADTKWAYEHQIGTGPFQLVKFVRDDRYVLEGVQNHWRKSPDVKKLTMIKVPDETVRLAMLRAGEADIANMSTENRATAIRDGFKTASAGTGSIHGVWFAGNLWEETHPTTGAKLERSTYVNPLPWIGDPFNAKFGNPPAGMDSMERARLVREALAWAVDRQLIVKEVLLGEGVPQYSEDFDIRDSLWQKKWEFGYDPAKAAALLDQAGYKKGSDGWRFEMPMYGWQSGEVAVISDAVAGMFREVGVRTVVLHYAYAVWRPTVVTRSATAPWTDFWQSRRPYDEPIGVQCSALTRGGKSRGAEAPQCTKNALGIAAERDSNNRLKLAYEYADWNRHWVLHFGTVSTDNSLVINPNYITSWEMFKGLRAVANSFEGIVLKK